MAGKPKIDWGKAKQEYLATKGMSLRDVSNTYGISYSAVRKVSANEGWVGEKDRIWGEAEKVAIEETEGSVKDLIKRHAKVARFLQAGGLKYLKSLLDEIGIDHDGNVNTEKLIKYLNNNVISVGNLLKMVSEGLKAERELYPKQMQVSGDLGLKAEGISEALEKAINDAFEKGLRAKPKTGSKAVSKK